MTKLGKKFLKRLYTGMFFHYNINCLYENKKGGRVKMILITNQFEQLNNKIFLHDMAE